MTLLEIIKKAAIEQETQTPESNYPIILNSDDILTNLKPDNQNPQSLSFIKPLKGWNITETDSSIIKSSNHFCKKLKRKLKHPKSLNKDDFFNLLNTFLEKNKATIGLSDKIDSDDSNYTCLLLKKLWFLITPNVASLVLEACVILELWDLVEILISEGVVARFSSVNLIESLVKKKESYLICLCIKHLSNIQSSDVGILLKYFLSPPKGAYNTMVNVRKEWEQQALLGIEKASDGSLSGENLGLAKQASVLLMIAYDEFSSAELCMHYLFASVELDEVTLSYSLSGLDGSDMLKLIRYFGKWIRKYLKFPQAGPCSKAATVLGLRLCEQVPSLESIVKYLGLVLDEYFSSLVLHSGFHDELRSLDEDVKSLASEARFCGSLANVVGHLKTEIELP